MEKGERGLSTSWTKGKWPRPTESKSDRKRSRQKTPLERGGEGDPSTSADCESKKQDGTTQTRAGFHVRRQGGLAKTCYKAPNYLRVLLSL